MAGGGDPRAALTPGSAVPAPAGVCDVHPCTGSSSSPAFLLQRDLQSLFRRSHPSCVQQRTPHTYPGVAAEVESTCIGLQFGECMVTASLWTRSLFLPPQSPCPSCPRCRGCSWGLSSAARVPASPHSFGARFVGPGKLHQCSSCTSSAMSTKESASPGMLHSPFSPERLVQVS